MGEIMKIPYIYIFLAMWRCEYLNIYILITYRPPTVGDVAMFRSPGRQVANKKYWQPENLDPMRNDAFEDRRKSLPGASFGWIRSPFFSPGSEEIDVISDAARYEK
jgi:hypothetical protein